MTTHLSVNLNKIALVRNARGRNFPAITEFGEIALMGGAIGLTIHPRPDQRHATYHDIADLKSLVAAFPGKELNVEGYPDDTLIQHVLDQRPDQFTLVPDDPNQITSDHGWDLNLHGQRLTPLIAQCQSAGIRTSLFVDPDLEQVRRAADTGTDRIELYTEAYAEAFNQQDYAPLLEQYMQCADLARSLGMTVNAGHDLDLDNLAPFVARGNIAEVSIGHALTVEALHLGFAETIKRYISILQRGR
ncbi:pyridoxine 5'-phosphate synthase [Salinispirillum marinum]|uniref:Pyridoxine 5'-phosphate synthase n=2 Tax=Saccharospirillaceae TaxID=255527 RepID=A0ABV8BAN8_9GAMM